MRKPLHLMLDRCDHYRPATRLERDQAGGQLDEWVLVHSAVPCKWVSKSSNPIEEYLKGT